MMDLAMPVGIIVFFIALLGIRIISQWQSGVVFRLGRFVRQISPGLNIIIPVLEYVKRVDMRIRTMDVIPQEIMTKDSVPVKIDAVVYYKIFDAPKSIIAVENFSMASTLLAQSKLRDVLGKYDLDTLLANKDQIGKEVLVALQGPTDEWGINIISVEIKNIELPDNMKRAMAKESEAVREKRSRLVKASAEEEASKSSPTPPRPWKRPQRDHAEAVADVAGDRRRAEQPDRPGAHRIRLDREKLQDGK
jgi:regulator of protease activity HflC (stomatin/prohibitin superfamily)